MAATLTFDVAVFRAQYPEFTNPPFTDAVLIGYWETATCFVSNKNCGSLRGACRLRALYLMVAHLCAIYNIIAAGQTPGQVQGATIDKVSVTLTPPPNPSQWAWWLGTTPYGAQLYALLQVRSVGGWYIGGLPETSAIRKVAGIK